MPAQGNGAPAPISSSLFADTPLGSLAPQDSDEAVIAALDKRIAEITDRNLNPMTRNRVTTREREEGIMAVFAKGVVKTLAGRGSRP